LVLGVQKYSQLIEFDELNELKSHSAHSISSVLKISEIGTDNFIYFQKFQIVFEICENIPSDHGSERAIFRNFRPGPPRGPGRKVMKIPARQRQVPLVLGVLKVNAYIFRNFRPGPFGLFPKYPTDILGGAGKFVKIYLPTHIWVGTGNFHKFQIRFEISENF
jgi:hypothetical protein